MPSEIIFLVTGGSGGNETAPRGASSMGVRYGANKKAASETRAVWFRGNLACLEGGGVGDVCVCVRGGQGYARLLR